MRTAAIVLAVLAAATVGVIRLVDGGDPSSRASSRAAAPATDAGAATPGVPAADAGGDELPPDDYEALAAIFEPALEPLGLRLTRGSLADSPGAGEDPSLRGRHLAVYVEPVSADHGAGDYLDTLITSARVFLPGVFETWPGLASMDVCQEPPPGVDDRQVPPPYTVLELGRAEAADVDWATVDLAGLLEAREAGRVRLFVDDAIVGHPAYGEAEAAAAARSPR